MFTFDVDLSVKPGMTKAPEVTYRDIFVPAISKQAGFSEVKLLRTLSSEAHSHRRAFMSSRYTSFRLVPPHGVPVELTWVAMPPRRIESRRQRG
jgi:hypothetical protein